MNLKEFGDGLKKIRIEKKISLTDISTETRINVKYLEAFERGEFDLLPQTYIRAFLKEYASFLNLIPDDILKQYNSAKEEKVEEQTSEKKQSPAPIRSKILQTSFVKKFYALTPIQRNMLFSAFIFLIAIFIIILANSKDYRDSTLTKNEISFDKVIKENEATSNIPTIVKDTLVQSYFTKKDSLRLEISTTDSVWISILIDGKKIKEHLFEANKKWSWTAKESFAITMGNAGGATFKLNNKVLGPIGKRGAVIRNFIITEANLKN